jgi:hypothetical protein
MQRDNQEPIGIGAATEAVGSATPQPNSIRHAMDDTGRELLHLWGFLNLEQRAALLRVAAAMVPHV